jgi:hypothetical protein
LGLDYISDRNKETINRRIAKRLEQPGHRVGAKPATTAPA